MPAHDTLPVTFKVTFIFIHTVALIVKILQQESKCEQPFFSFDHQPNVLFVDCLSFMKYYKSELNRSTDIVLFFLNKSDIPVRQNAATPHMLSSGL